MKFAVTRTSIWDAQDAKELKIDEIIKSMPTRSGLMIKHYIKINSLKELLAFREKYGHDLVITENIDNELEIEIYDDYRE